MFGEIAVGEWIMLFVRWAHAIGAVAWIGGSIFFAFILRPVERANPDLVRPVLQPLGSVYRELVDIAVIAIIVSGIILMFDRLTGGDASVQWFIVLAVKLALALWMFYLVWRFRQSDFDSTEKPSGIAARMRRRLVRTHRRRGCRRARPRPAVTPGPGTGGWVGRAPPCGGCGALRPADLQRWAR